ncbi:MAG: CoA transferase [Rhodospirillales bacterium]|nr:CoA transferase [Rhodospirillales bacterium]
MRSDDALALIWSGLGGAADDTSQVRFTAEGAMPSVYPTTDLAAASIGAAGLALAALAGHRGEIAVDRRLAAAWFLSSIRPQGWQVPPTWDAVAGDYQGADGWIRLHTNAPHHRRAALAVLGTPPEREAVAEAVRGWPIEALESAVVEAGGAAAAMRSAAAWAAHPQGAAVAAEPLVWIEHHPGTPHRPADPARPLAGIRVLDLTRILAGPTATRFLAGCGATVLRLDPPDWQEMSLAPEVTLGKHCARLDLRRQREVFLALLADADVLVHGYRPGALDGLGLDAETRRRARPGLVDVSLDAYGWTGPWAGRRGFDSLIQMSSGIAEAGMRAAGAAKPVPLPAQALDHATGYMIAATVLRGLAQGGLRARLSLARTAQLLKEIPAAEAAPAFAPLDDADYAAEPEHTAWGPQARLTAPLRFDGKPALRWARAAGPLGSVAALWPE